MYKNSYFSIPLIFFSSSFSSPLLFFFFFPSLHSSFLPIRFCLSPNTKMRYLFWSYPYLILICFLFFIFGPQTPFYLHFHLFKFLLWHTIFYSYVIWVLNWKFTNLPLTFVLISGFSFQVLLILFLESGKIYIYCYYTLNML